jgi:hypothetical protein
MLTYEQFRFSFASAISENEARRLYEAYPVAGSGIPLFQERSRRASLLVPRILFAGSAQPHCRARQSSYLTMRARDRFTR